MSEFTEINIETLVLVAVWNEPSIFQGCFKISDKHSTRKRYIFFRCECLHPDKHTFLKKDFSPYDYQWTYLYEEITQSYWDISDESKEDVFYVLKYALQVTLFKMLQNRKYDFLSIDEVAMQAMLEQIQPMLQKSEASWSKDYPDLGFAVSMDFTPHEPMAEKAAVMLLGKRSLLN